MPTPAAETPVARSGGLRRALRRTLVWLAGTALVLILFAGTLVVTMPAAVAARLVTLPAQVEALSGSVWSGRAGLRGGHSLTWDVAFGRILLGQVGFTWQLTGEDTLVDGALRLSPWGWRVDDLAGRAGPGLLALADNLVVTGCTTRAVIAVPLLEQRRRRVAAEGTVRLAAGTCTTDLGDDIAIPALLVTLTTEGRDALATLATDDAAATPLARARVTADRRLILRIEPEGAALVPGMPSSRPTELEYPF